MTRTTGQTMRWIAATARQTLIWMTATGTAEDWKLTCADSEFTEWND